MARIVRKYEVVRTIRKNMEDLLISKPYFRERSGREICDQLGYAFTKANAAQVYTAKRNVRETYPESPESSTPPLSNEPVTTIELPFMNLEEIEESLQKIRDDFSSSELLEQITAMILHSRYLLEAVSRLKEYVSQLEAENDQLKKSNSLSEFDNKVKS